ncbi:hypothetical protein RND81_03G092800 [Saponaria officinalis]|uniref:Protein kinase domain-containing protein n=1 Tax=Saponaria officinalis TaxID=3572 RepID=A0AAW1LZK3_SAPOF
MNPITLSLFFLLSFSLLPPAFSAVATETDTSALTALKSALGGRWNTTGNNACSWQGVVCDPAGQVTELHLPAVGFLGPIPSNIIGNLTSLYFLSLRYNAFSGSIPSDFAALSKLKYLYLQHNRLSGPIPGFLFNLSNLIRVDLSENRFSGGISNGFNNLSILSALFLQNNQFTGEIPDLRMSNLKEFNVSYNLLTGIVPEQLCSAFPSTAFQGNSLTACPFKPSSNGKKTLSSGAIAGIVIGSVVALLALLLLIFFCCCRRKKTEDQPTPTPIEAVKQPEVENGQSSGAAPVSKSKAGSSIDKKLVFFGNTPRVFDLDDLLKASAEVLGKGNYGTTYKAALENGVVVVVKRLKEVTASEKELKDKLEEIGKLENENLVALRGYHCSPNEKLLVYDYLPMGSLSAFLHGNKGSGRTPFNWETRCTIALGVANGITYIHSKHPTSSHGNIRSSNILLSNSFEARVSETGLAQLANPSAGPTRVAGYRAPEVTDPRKVSQKADIYSFGVFLLELLTGKAPTHALLNEEGVDLPRWVQSVVREEWATEVFDMELLRYQNAEEEMVQLLQLAIDCCAQYPDNRPSMTEVTDRIEEICRSTAKASQEPLSDLTSDGENNLRPS